VGHRRVVRMTRRPLRLLLVAAAALTLLVGGCADEQAPSVGEGTDTPVEPPAGLPHLDVPDDALLLVAADPDAGEPQLLGTGDFDVRVSRMDDGSLAVVEGLDGQPAFAFPEYRDSLSYPRAGIAISNAGSEDQLNPGEQDFVFGADFRLDAKSVGRDEDNGNNVIQRGLSSDPVMFKLDIDADHRPGCAIKTAEGRVQIYARQPVEDDLWHRVHCERQGDTLHVIVSEYLPTGQVTTSGRSTTGAAGDVTFADAETPVAVGAKMAKNGGLITSATDQFNGDIANPFLLIGRVDHGSD
jgi:hypothetical protein